MAIVTPDKLKIKDKRVQVYYDVVERTRSGEIRKRFWLHQKDKKLYAYVRDYKQGITVANSTVSLDIDVIFILNYNKQILEHYSDPIVIVFNGQDYLATAKPDEYEHYKGDIKIMAKKFCKTYIPDQEHWQDKPIHPPLPPIPVVKRWVVSVDNFVGIVDNFVAVILD